MRKLIDSHGGLLRLLSSVLSLPWTGATWAVDGNARAYNTPTLGSELLTDGGLENWASATNLTSWTENVAGLSTINREDSIINSGTYAARFDVNSTSNVYIEQAGVLTSGKYYSVGGALRNEGSTRSIYTQLGTSQIIFPSLTQSYAVYRVTGRANGTIIYFFRLVAVTHTLYLDDLTCKELSLPTLFASVAGSGNAQIATAKINAITSGTQAGVISHLDDAASPANFIIAYHNGTSAIMDKCVGGTYTNLVTATVSFVSDAAIEIRPLGSNQFDCYYNGSKQGNTATVSDAGIISNTRYGLFSTYSGNTFSEFTLGGAVVALTLPGA